MLILNREKFKYFFKKFQKFTRRIFLVRKKILKICKFNSLQKLGDKMTRTIAPGPWMCVVV